MSNILAMARKPLVEFDPYNKDHLRVVQRVLDGKSIATEAFRLSFDVPFTSAITSALDRIAREWIKERGGHVE
jgi:hypothetical protein